jgi:hypothetical protein
MRGVWAVGAALATLPAMAQEPPRWANLAECSAVFRSVALSRGYEGVTDAQIAAAEAAAQRFRARAVEVAAEMGQVDAEGDVASIMVYLEPRWENRIGRLLSVKSNLDWIGYCGDLGSAEGVLTPDP